MTLPYVLKTFPLSIKVIDGRDEVILSIGTSYSASTFYKIKKIIEEARERLKKIAEVYNYTGVIKINNIEEKEII